RLAGCKRRHGLGDDAEVCRLPRLLRRALLHALQHRLVEDLVTLRFALQLSQPHVFGFLARCALYYLLEAGLQRGLAAGGNLVLVFQRRYDATDFIVDLVVQALLLSPYLEYGGVAVAEPRIQAVFIAGDLSELGPQRRDQRRLQELAEPPVVDIATVGLHA